MEIRKFNMLEDALAAGFTIELGNGEYGKPKVPQKTYDSRCYDLGETFLEDTPHLNTEKRRNELAALIQQTIEDFINYEQSNYVPSDPPGFEAGFASNH